MSLETLEADTAALTAAGAAAEEALALHRQALAVLGEGWHSQSGSAAADLLRRQCDDAFGVVTALHAVAGELRSLRDATERVPAERPPAGADAPRETVPPPLPPPPPAPLPALGPGPTLPALPNVGAGLGSGLAALVATIAEALSSDALSSDAPSGDAPDDEDTDVTTPEPAAAETVRSPPRPAVDPPSPQPPVAPLQPEPQVVQGGSAATPAAAPAVSEPAMPEPPLLAAERPPEPDVAAPAQSPLPAEPVQARTPCEIAADELPQVGQ